MSHYTAPFAAFFLTLCMVNTPALATDTDKPELTVYTYDSFISEWGMGPLIKPTFEASCGCTLNLVGMEDAVSMLQRLKLEGVSTKADLVLGLDLNLVDDAKNSGLFATHKVNTTALEMPINWQDDTFVPFDYGYFSFVYNTQLMPNPPKSLDELVNAGPELKIIIQDPRSSTPGLGLLLWMKAVYGDDSDAAWAKLSDNILTTTKGWSEAYFSLFLAGEAPMVLSYSTSPAYHMAIEGTDQYQAAAFEEGHYLQVEVAAKLKSSNNELLADEFLNFMVSEDFQKHLPLSNVMYPVNTPKDMPEAYSKLIVPNKVLQLDTAEINQSRKQWVSDWLNAMTQ